MRRTEGRDAMIDVKLLSDIAAALLVCRAQGAGHFANVGPTAANKTVPGQAVYAATKKAPRPSTWCY